LNSLPIATSEWQNSLPKAKARRRTPQGDAELMTKKQVLGFKPAPRLEKVDDEPSE
jgi:hypothetical protein